MESRTQSRLDEIIRQRGGEQLTPSGKTVDEKIRVRCREGHVWSVKPASMLYSGTWCRVCASRKRQIGLKALQKVAGERGGRCLAEKYEKRDTPLDWECDKGHRFRLSSRMVRAGSWCPECRDKKPGRLSMDIAVEIARENHGRHTGYATALRKKTTWVCQEGHQFEATGLSIINRKYFCPECDGVRPPTIDSIKEECIRRGGKCLSEQYPGSDKLMLFECEEGHQWESRWRIVGNQESWCPRCARKRKNVHELYRIARRYGGELISENHVDNKFRYAWRCSQGHEFAALAKDASKRWCPDCASESPHEKVARRHDGQCVSVEESRWKCSEGHEFIASLTAAAMAWCPICLTADTDSVERQMARKPHDNGMTRPDARP